MSKKGHEIKAQQAHTDEALNAAFNEFYAGFLTAKEMREVIDGRDMWMTSDEVARRWQLKLAHSTTSTDRICDPIPDLPIPARRGRPRKA